MAREEERGESLRLLYVALTRASSLVVAHWAPSQQNTETAPLHRLLCARSAGEIRPRPRYPVKSPPTGWLTGSAHVALELVPASPPASRWSPPAAATPVLAVAPYDRVVDTTWKRTSYTGLTAGLHGADAPERAPLDHRADEPDDEQPLPPEGIGDRDTLRRTSPCPRGSRSCPPARRSGPWSTGSSRRSTPTPRT